MEIVLMTILGLSIVLAILIYPKKDTFIEKVRFKGSLKAFELEICAKEKNCPPGKKDSSNQK